MVNIITGTIDVYNEYIYLDPQRILCNHCILCENQGMYKDDTEEFKKLRRDIIALYDDFSEFSDQCAFLCDAFGAIPVNSEAIEPATKRGIGIYANWIKGRLVEIQTDLGDLHTLVKILN